MKQAFRLIAIFTLLLAPFISVSAEVGEDNVDFGTIKVGNSNFNFKCEWIYSGSEKFSSASNRDFILYNGNIYFNDYRNNAKYSFAIIDASTGEFKQTLKLNWPGQASKRFSVFVGRDSNGTPFCTTEGTPSTPFELCTLKFDASGIPSPDKLFTFPLRADWYVRSVDVGGDISSGNFTIYATIWKSDEMNVNKSTDTGLAAWKVTNGNIGAPEFISKNLTITDIEPLDENRFIIVCRGPYNNKNNAGYRVPTLCEWNTITGEWTEYETFPCKMFSKCTNAVERFTLGGKQFLAYWNATGLVTTEAREGSHFGLAYTPDLPTSFNSAQTIIEKFGIGNSSIDYEDVAMWSWKANSSVHTEKISDNAVRIVINDRGGNLRSYTLTTDAPQPPVIKKEEPVFNPASGTQLKKGDKVTVSCEGAIMMLYRLDGASALQYTEPIAVENDCTIEAWGIYSDGEGPHATASYTVEKPIAKVAPTFNPASGTQLKKGDKVTIACEGAIMMLYRLDGASALQYTEPIAVENDCTIEAWGIYSDGEGPHATASYTVEKPIAKVAPTFNPASGTQLKKGDKVTIACEGAIMMLYRLDGASALQYTEPIAVENDCTIEAWGIYSDGEGPHATASYTVEKPIAKVAPTFNPASGTQLKKGDKVTIACEGAIMMLYRLDGASALQYTEPIAVENDCTIEAWGIYSDGEGPHATASYTVEKPIAKVAPTFNPASGTQLKKGDKVTIACEGAIMMLYRLDGAPAIQYTEPIAVENDCTIEAWGIYSDGEGPHATASYTVEKPIAKVAPTFNPASGTQLKKGDKVTVSCEGAIMMLYRLDDASAIQYTEPIAVENDCSIEAWGIYSDGEGPHATASYTIEKPVPKVAPTFNPASGTQLKKGEKVTIACDGALLIKYRYNNGVTQTYTAPIEPEIDCTIDAWGIFPDGEGPRATAKYSVEKPVVMTAPIFDPVSGTELDRGQKIKLSCKDAMLIMYKIDNGDAMMYESAIKIKDECTVEAWGVFSAGEGPHATAHYTIKKETERHAPVFNPASGSTLKKGESINITCQDATLILYRINNGSITPYLSDPIVIENDCEIEAWGIYPSQDGPHAIAKYYIESEENDCYLATTSHNDIQSGMSVKIGAIHEGNLFAAMPCGVSGLSGGILGELGNNLSHISTTSPTGTFIVDVCNRGGYTIRDEASGEYLRQIANGELTLGDYDNAESFYLNYENRDNLLYTAITNKEGDMTMVYDNEYGHFIFKSEARSNIILYRYAPYGKPEIPNTLYLHRSFSGNWDLSLPVETINTENRKIILDSFYIPKEETADIFIANMKSTGESGGTDWLEITRGIIYIPAENIEYAADGTMVGMIAYPEGHYMGVKPPTAKLGGGYTYSLTVEFGGFSPILHITKTSGTTDIDGISEDEGSPVYYNLQGIQIDNPQPGIYIERRGNKIRKVFIK